jgi:hypothetical protein
MPESLYAVLPSADGQPAIDTQWSANYQEAIDGGADAFEQWLADQNEPLASCLNNHKQRLPGRAVDAFELGFLHRLEQRLRSQNPTPCKSVEQFTGALALGNRATAMMRLSLESTLQLANKGELRACTEEAAQHLVKTANLAAAISLPDASFMPSEGLFHD